MKKLTKITSYVALILVLIATYLRLDQNKDLKQQVKELEQANTLLQAQVDSTHIKIAELDIIAEGYKIQIEQDKVKLADLQAKADLYKRKYNEEHNRITELSGDALVSEFTNAFN